MIFETETGSVYEVENNCIRRLSGFKDPTPRQGEDGEWKEFMHITPILIGERVLITWAAVEEVSEKLHDVILKGTLTSVVTKIDTGWVNDKP